VSIFSFGNARSRRSRLAFHSAPISPPSMRYRCCEGNAPLSMRVTVIGLLMCLAPFSLAPVSKTAAPQSGR
jgi:hypothetical protein